MIVPGKVPTMRCCVYKERAILAERVKLAMGGGNTGNIINVIDIACDDCPAVGYQVTDSCRGCLAHRCEDACRRGAISFDHNHEAHIDKTKCVECGQCAKVCPYSAIVNRKRPCQNACKIKAISINEDNAAKIDDEKCIQCGACVYQCPFGAISDRSFIINVIDMLKKSQGNTKYKVYALVAPAIGSQLNYAKLGQVITGIKELGFYTVVEVALGADMVGGPGGIQGIDGKRLLDLLLLPGVRALCQNRLPRPGSLYLPQSIAHGDHRQIHQGTRNKREDRVHRPLHGEKGGGAAGRCEALGGRCYHL